MYFIAQKMFLFDILVALSAYNHIWISFLKEKAAILNRDANNIRGIQLIEPSCSQNILSYLCYRPLLRVNTLLTV